MMYAEIIPLLRLPRSIEVFDYKVPTDLELTLTVGQAVLVQFRGRLVTGIVARMKDQSSAATAPIDRLLDHIPLLDAAILTLLREFANDTFVSPGLFLRHALPEVPRRVHTSPLPTRHYLGEARKAEGGSNLTVSGSLVEKLKSALTTIRQHHRVSLRVDDSHLVSSLLIRLGLEAQTTHKSMLVLVPTQEQAVTLAAYLRTHGVSTACTLSTDAKVKTYMLWRAFERGDVSVVVGTRQALFFPMRTGGRYILIDETAEEWKQSEINPRIDARILLPKLAAHHNATLLTITPQLSISYFHDCKNMMRLYTSVHTPVVATITTMPRATLFSESLIAAMEGKQKALFFVHRKGRAALLRCNDCGFTATCSICDLVLAVHRTFLRCTACDTRHDLPLACSKCGSAELRTHGVGTEQVEEAGHKAFPHTDITVSTSAFLNQCPITKPTPQFDLVAIVEADTMLHRPDFRSQEKLARIVNRLRQIASANKAPFIIQTYFSEFSVWASGGNHEEQWIREELENRETLHYPPAWRIAKLVFQHKNQKNTLAQATDTHHIILSATKDLPVEISEPTPATPPKIRGQYHYLIILRFKSECYPAVKPHLTALPDDVIIDLDPIDILR